MPRADSIQFTRRGGSDCGILKCSPTGTILPIVGVAGVTPGCAHHRSVTQRIDNHRHTC